MGSKVKSIAKGIAVGALVGLTGGAAAVALGFAPALTTIGGVVVGGAFKSALIGATLGGLSAASQAFVSKPSMDTSTAIGRLTTSQDPNAPGMWVFGETPCSLDLVYAENEQDERGIQVFHAASHRIHSFGDFYVNDGLVNFSSGVSTGSWDGVIERFTRIGTSTQTAPTGFGAWPSTARGRGFAHFGLSWQFGADKTEGGIPGRLTQVVKGCPVYDPRKDDTNGGTGAHRADDRDTWEYESGGVQLGANWALVVLCYLLGWYENGKLVWGVGVDPEDIDWDQAAAAANVCDEVQDDKPRYRVGGAFRTDQNHEAIIQQLEAAIGGKVARVGGKYFIWAPHDDLVPVMELTDDHLVPDVGVEYSPSGPLTSLFNTARGQFIDPGALYQEAPYPEVVEAAAVTEDGRTRLKEQTFSIIQDVEIAQRVARELIRRSRFSGSWRFALGPIGLRLRPFSVVTLRIRETNYEPQLARVTALGFSSLGVVGVELLEEDASIYDTDLPLGTPVTRLDPNSYNPATPVQITGFGATAATVTGSAGTAVDAFAVTWATPPGRVAQTEVQYRVAGTGTWQQAAPARVDFVSAIIAPVEPGTDYDLRARHLTRERVPGDWVVLQRTAGVSYRVPTASIEGLTAGQNLASAAWVTPFLSNNSAYTIRDRTLSLSALAAAVGDVISAAFSVTIIDLNGSDRVPRLKVRYLDSGGSLIREDDGNSVSAGTGLSTIENSEIPTGTTDVLFRWFRGGADSGSASEMQFNWLMVNRGARILPFEQPPTRVNRGEVEEGADVTALHSNELDNPEFEAGDKAWTGLTAGGNQGWSIVQDAANARAGNWCAKLDSGGSNNYLESSKKIQVNAGDRVLAQCFAKRTGGTGTIACQIAWKDAAGTEVGTANGDEITSSAYALSRRVAIAPAGTAYYQMRARQFVATGTSGYVDGFYSATIPKNSDIDALLTQNSPQEAGANVTETRTSANTGAVAGEDALTVEEATQRAIAALEATGAVKAAKVLTESMQANAATEIDHDAPTGTRTSSGPTDVEIACSLSKTVFGGPVLIETFLFMRRNSSADTFAKVEIYRDNVLLDFAGGNISLNETGVFGTTDTYKPVAVMGVDNPGAGTYTYEVRFYASEASTTVVTRDRALIATELKR